MKDYTLLHPVFQINGAKDCKERVDLCFVAYVRVMDNIHPNVAVQQLREELAKKYDVPVDRVIFHFFADQTAVQGGGPQVIE